jgi:hypothetical protein
MATHISAEQVKAGQWEQKTVLCLDWLYFKPCDFAPGNPNYYHEVYQVLDLLEEMDVPPRGRILEVGSSSGWVTEILLGLGLEVDAIEPS